MAYKKNKNNILEKILEKTLRKEKDIFDENELYIGGRPLTFKFEPTSEDILYRLCKQKGIAFEDLSLLFEWFAKKDKLYVVSRNISKNMDVDINELEKMSHRKILALFKKMENCKFFSYKFSDRSIYFFSYSEPEPLAIYYGNSRIKRIAKKGMGFDEDGNKGSLYRIALHKLDHEY
ncbi:MAG: hypothetical protein N3G19_00235 [Candidatus Pacearchaeota archaeon]|nr:hypothetical protein [Candidatus Pacearchaeota archaeon]